MKNISINFLKLVVLLLGVIVIVWCSFALPEIIKEVVHTYPEITYALYLFVFGAYVAVIPIFIALYWAFRLLDLISQDKLFSSLSIRALGLIKYCAITISLLYVLCMPLFFYVGDQDDAPGLVLIGLFIICAPIVTVAISNVIQGVIKKEKLC